MKYLTVSQYAEMRGVSTQYIRKCCAQGKIIAIKIGPRMWLIPYNEDKHEIQRQRT